MKEYKYWPTGDIIRVVATFTVLFIHITQYSVRTSTSLDIAWWSLNIGQSLSIWAVPAFIMLSGALLLSPQSLDESPLVFYKKRLLRIGIPLLFWGVVYFFLEKKWSPDISLEYLIDDLWHGHISWHLYFLFAILGLYLLTPWLRLLIKKISTKREELILIIILLFITTCVDSYNQIFQLWKWHGTLRWVSYLGYYLVGRFLLCHTIDNIRIFIILSVTGLISNIMGRYLEMLFQTGASGFFYSNLYSSVTVMIFSIGIFGMLIYLTKEITENSKIVKICRLLAPSTFGVYLVHILIGQELHFRFNLQYPHDILIALIYTVILNVSSMLLVYLIGLIPLFRFLVGCHTQRTLEDNKIYIFYLKKYFLGKLTRTSDEEISIKS
ncbi:acyltransferase family protein [Cronbergia sp. UHCC 0137]|uniref:acyltransferase n=1 Tax=Cronbergia sp. UHCC 0137 TaxID=3110239 RepID=UPI002B21D408|nr:acyltransferase family protein [Cronbergia sp. UHCC 0137]MEA5616266.1 acyltransferase family protein [Cronbergia sp. UHCC 0137]